MSIAYGDDNSDRRNDPVVVPVLIVLNLIVFLIQLGSWDRSIFGWGMVPYEITHHTDLVGEYEVTAGKNAILPAQAEQPEAAEEEKKPETELYYPAPFSPYLTLFTAMFLHGGVMHVLGNMMYLGIFGDQIEDRLGKTRFLVFYIVCGLIANVGYLLVYPDSKIPTVGASGAIAGVMGAYVVLHPDKKVNVMFLYQFMEWPAWLFHGVWFLMQTFGQFGIFGGGQVAYMAHIAGFVAGFISVGLVKVLDFPKAPPPRKKSARPRKRRALHLSAAEH